METRPKEILLDGHLLKFEDEADPGEFFVEKAEKELRETPQNKVEALARLQQLLAGEQDLQIPLNIEPFLLAYLRVCHFYPESAFARICRQYHFRNKHPKSYNNLVPTADKNVFQNNLLTILPYRDQHGRRILIIEAGMKWKTKEVTLLEIIRGVLLVVEAATLEPKTQIAGAVVIIDLQGLSVQHVWQFSPSIAKMLLEWVQECLPCRIKAIHIVNQPYIFNMLFAIFKPFIKEKLRNRIFFHGENRESLLEHIDAKSLPINYGGHLNISQNNGIMLYNLLYQYNDEYEEFNGYGYNKKKKEGKKSEGS